MREIVRAMVIPFFVALFPALWYVNRNLSTAVLPPRIDPSPALAGLAILGAVAGAIAFAAVVVGLRVTVIGRPAVDPGEDSPSALSRRALYPDGSTIVVYLVLFFGAVALGLADALEIEWLRFLLLPFAPIVLLPLYVATTFLVVLELEGFDHVGTVIGLAASAVWLALLSSAVSDRLGLRPGG